MLQFGINVIDYFPDFKPAPGGILRREQSRSKFQPGQGARPPPSNAAQVNQNQNQPFRFRPLGAGGGHVPQPPTTMYNKFPPSSAPPNVRSGPAPGVPVQQPPHAARLGSYSGPGYQQPAGQQQQQARIGAMRLNAPLPSHLRYGEQRWRRKSVGDEEKTATRGMPLFQCSFLFFVHIKYCTAFECYWDWFETRFICAPSSLRSFDFSPMIYSLIHVFIDLFWINHLY